MHVFALIDRKSLRPSQIWLETFNVGLTCFVDLKLSHFIHLGFMHLTYRLSVNVELKDLNNFPISVHW